MSLVFRNVLSLREETEDRVKSVPDCQTRSVRITLAPPLRQIRGDQNDAHGDMSLYGFSSYQIYLTVGQKYNAHISDIEASPPLVPRMAKNDLDFLTDSRSPVSKGGKLSGSSLNSASI